MPTRKPKRTNWRQRAESAEAQVEQLVGDIQAVSQDYTDAKRALDASESRNAELLKERETDGCICAGNWRKIVAEHENDLEASYLDDKGRRFRLIGIVHGRDDYYYGMSGPYGLRLLSCVGSIEAYGLTKAPEAEYCLCGETAPDCKCEQKFGKPQSWLQRVWRKWRA